MLNKVTVKPSTYAEQVFVSCSDLYSSINHHVARNVPELKREHARAFSYHTAMLYVKFVRCHENFVHVYNLIWLNGRETLLAS